MNELNLEAFIDPIKKLVMVRLMTTRIKGISKKGIADNLSPFFEDRLTPAEWSRIFPDAIQSLIDTNSIEPVPIKKGVSKMFRLTSTGYKNAVEYLDAEYFPKKLSWQDHLKNKYLPARALGIPIQTKKDFINFKLSIIPILILKKEFDLPVPVFPTSTQVWDALFWHGLGVSSEQKFSMENVKTYLLNNLLGADSSLKQADAKKVLPAKLIDSRNPGNDAIVKALLNRLTTIDKSSMRKTSPKSPTVSSPVSSQSHDASLNLNFDLKAFAKKVLQLASDSPAGWHGNDRVFISHAWKYFKKHALDYRLNETEFKQYLVEANKASYLRLSKADLPIYLDTEDLKNSATPYLNIVFHFINVPKKG